MSWLRTLLGRRPRPSPWKCARSACVRPPPPVGLQTDRRLAENRRHAGHTAGMTGMRSIALTVNGRPCLATVEPRTTLVDLLREGFRLTGTHVGCEQGVCGACTVLLDGEPVRGCLLLAVQAHGRNVETVESLAPDAAHLNALQAQLVRHHGVQCGFCTAGILMSLTAALRHHPRPTEAEVRETLAGHLCRCTGYQGIVDAVLALAAGATSPAAVNDEAAESEPSRV